MKLSTVPFISFIIASLLCLTVADTANEVTNEVGEDRELVAGQKRTIMKQKQNRHNFRKNQHNKPNNDWSHPNDWKEPNDWNHPNHHWNKPNDWNKPYDDYMKLVLMESDCEYNYTSSNSDDPTNLFPIDTTDGTLNTAGIWRPGSYVFKGCDLYYKGGNSKNNMYYGPIKAGRTDMTCLVTKVDVESDGGTPDAGVGNVGFLDCTIVDSLLSNKHSKYDNGWGMESSYLNNAHMYYSATLRSQGYMGVWDSNFKAATIGGTGGGIKASGQMNYIQSEYKNQFVHYYYIDAPYLEKGFPW